MVWHAARPLVIVAAALLVLVAPAAKVLGAFVLDWYGVAPD